MLLKASAQLGFAVRVQRGSLHYLGGCLWNNVGNNPKTDVVIHWIRIAHRHGRIGNIFWGLSILHSQRVQQEEVEAIDGLVCRATALAWVVLITKSARLAGYYTSPRYDEHWNWGLEMALDYYFTALSAAESGIIIAIGLKYDWIITKINK